MSDGCFDAKMHFWKSMGATQKMLKSGRRSSNVNEDVLSGVKIFPKAKDDVPFAAKIFRDVHEELRSGDFFSEVVYGFIDARLF